MLAFFVGPILFPKVPLFLLEIVSGIFPCKQSGFAITKQDVGPPLETTWVAQIHWNEMKVIQSCPTLCDPMDCSLPASSVHEILQARILEWVAIPFSKGSSWSKDWTWVSCIAGRFFTIWATKEPSHRFIGSDLSDNLPFPGQTYSPELCIGYGLEWWHVWGRSCFWAFHFLGGAIRSIEPVPKPPLSAARNHFVTVSTRLVVF